MNKAFENDPRWTTAQRICQQLTDAGHRALLAGGCVRDLLLERTPKDYDIATSARPQEVVTIFPRSVDVGAAFGVIALPTDSGTFEVATFRKDGPYLDGRHPASVEFLDEKEDAKRRDFTINALFFDPETGEIIDYVDGQADLEGKRIRAVGNPSQRFDEDHLRLVRAVRFAARLEFDIDPETFAAVKQSAHLITKTSAERIRDEIVKILTEGHAKRGLELLDESGLLEHILPEIARMKGVEQPAEYHPEGDVFVHTLLVMDQLDNPSPTLALGALLHDVGKPLTQTFEDRIRFNNHDKVGARESERIGRRLRLSNDTIDRVSWLIEQHMRVAAAPDMRESKLKRLVRAEGFEELLELHRADCMGSHRKLDLYDWLKEYRANLQPEQMSPPPLIRGARLIAMGYTPGPLFAEILTTVEDRQLEGALTNPTDAEEFVRASWPLNR